MVRLKVRENVSPQSTRKSLTSKYQKMALFKVPENVSPLKVPENVQLHIEVRDNVPTSLKVPENVLPVQKMYHLSLKVNENVPSCNVNPSLTDEAVFPYASFG
jgi:hypothetical protein